MAYKSLIEWTESTWNPVTGCTKISNGCLNCYAERMAKRLAGRYGYPKEKPFQVTLHPERLEQPIRLLRKHVIFVCSMSDFFHSDISENFRLKIMDVIRRCPQHIFQILTKREEKMLDFSRKIEVWPDNVWVGVTIEAKEYKKRIDYLKEIDASVKFLSCEPLLNDLGMLNLEGINWVIVGGESGFNARQICSEWATNIRDQCLSRNIPYFFKQWGGINKKAAGRFLEGKEWNQMPIEAFLKS